MKKKYRDQALNALFNELKSKVFDTRENALFQLGLMLERSNQGDALADAPDIYSDNLSREMLRIALSKDEQNRVIDQLSRLVATQKDSRPTAFWTLGKANSELVFAPLLSLIQATGNQLNNEAAYQACDALRRCLETGVMDNDAIAAQLKLQNPTSLLERWSESSDERLADSVERVLDLLDG